MFTNEDKRVIREIAQSVAAINDRIDIHKQLVEINANLKSIREGLERTDMTAAQEAEVQAKLKESLEGLKEVGKES